MVKSCGVGRSPSTSSQVSGVETPAKRAGARAVGAGQRLALDVLQVVDVDACRPCACRTDALDRGRPSDACRRPSWRRSGRTACRPRTACRRQRDEDVQRLRSPRSWGSRRRRRASSSSRTQRAHVEDLRERRAGLRIEIDGDLVGLSSASTRREPRVHRDRGELRHVEQRLQRCRRSSARRHVVVRQRLDAHARRHRVGRAVLVERPGRRRRWAAASSPAAGWRRTGRMQRRDARVVAQQVALGAAALGPEHLVRGW